MIDEPHHGDPPASDGDDPERSLVVALRWAVLPAASMPASLAAVAVSAAGSGLAPALAAPLAALAIVVNAVCWRKVIVLWRRLPRPGDDDQGWPRWWRGTDSPRDPSGGPGGIRVDWARFERDFWSHVSELERLREREPIRALSTIASRRIAGLAVALWWARAAHQLAH